MDVPVPLAVEMPQILERFVQRLMSDIQSHIARRLAIVDQLDRHLGAELAAPDLEIDAIEHPELAAFFERNFPSLTAVVQLCSAPVEAPAFSATIFTSNSINVSHRRAIRPG